MAPTLSTEQLKEVREFFQSPTAELLFLSLEHGQVNDWVNCQDRDERDECWRMLQAILQLKFTLRDSAAMKKLSERNQERRMYSS